MEDFAKEKQPWGLGYEMAALDAIVQERLEGQRRQKLEDLPEAKPGTRNDLTSYHRGTRLDAESNQPAHSHRRLRAIKERVPTIVRQFYENDLIGEKEASKLGLCNPDSQQEETIQEVVTFLESMSVTDKTSKEKQAVKRQVNKSLKAGEQSQLYKGSRQS